VGFLNSNIGEVAPLKGKGYRMSFKQMKFCVEYLVDYDHAKAAERSGYTGDNLIKIGQRLLKHPLVKEEITKRQNARSERLELKADEILTRLLRLANEAEKDSDKIRSLELLGKHLAMWRDRQEISGPDGEAIKYEQKVQEDAADFSRAIARLAKRGGETPMVKLVDGGAESEAEVALGVLGKAKSA
jgi:phage terminase small subunit